MKISHYINTAVIFILTVFAVFSVYGAFIGAEQAKTFFNSMPMVVFWCLLLLLFIVGFFVYPSLKKRRSLMLIHLGCIFVLAGGMIGSEKGHALSDRLLGEYSFLKGMMQLQPGQSSNRVYIQAGSDGAKLPFSIHLKDAFVEYYDQPAILIHLKDGTVFKMSTVERQPVEIPNRSETIQVTRVFQNFKMKRQDGRMVPYDSSETGSNRAYEITLTLAGGQTESIFVFERFPMHAMAGRSFHAEYIRPRMVKDYKSVLQVTEEGRVMKEATIEVNKPLYYAGYHFYQNTFAFDQSVPVSGIEVVSARGVWPVFIGYGLIFVGAVIQFGSKLRKGALR